MKLYYLQLLCLFIVVLGCDTDTVIVDDDDVNQTSKPNILLIIADDMGLDATPGYSIAGTKPSMPTLDGLMANGVKFTNVWSSPLCSPTRAGIITGKYGFRTGVTNVGQTLPTSEQSIHGYLDAINSGYSHAVIGKWHLSNRDVNHPNSIGVNEYAGVLGGGVPSYFSWDLVANRQTTNSTTYTTTKFTDLAIDWIENQDTPWFLWLAYNAPHTPFHLPPNALHSQGPLASDEASIAANPLPYYLAMIEAMDTEIGRLLDAMPQEERDNTVIIFVGDNGTPNQVVQTYRSRRAKNSLYQGGINVPMVVSGKNVTRMGAEEDALLGTTDLFATVAGIAGANITEIHDSKNFAPMFTNANVSVRDFVYSEIGDDANSTDFAIRDATYKYISFSNGNEAFYNVLDDPLETTNLLNANQLPLSNAATTAKQNIEAALINIKQ
jgi:arylsulfatase A-like enzyme